MVYTETLTRTKERADMYLQLYTDCMKYKKSEKREIDCSTYYKLFENSSIKYMGIKEEHSNKHR